MHLNDLAARVKEGVQAASLVRTCSGPGGCATRSRRLLLLNAASSHRRCSVIQMVARAEPTAVHFTSNENCLRPTQVGYRFNTIGVSDGISMGTEGMSFSLQSRDLIADSIETVRAPFLLRPCGAPHRSGSLAVSQLQCQRRPLTSRWILFGF